MLMRIDAEDDVKLCDSLPTLALLSDSGARVVIATHCGSQPDALRLKEVTGRLEQLLGRAIGRLSDWKTETGLSAVAHLAEGEVVMIEDLALEPGEKTGDEKLADDLVRLCDIYCNDAFALSHEVRASTVGAAGAAKLAVAGLAFEREWNILNLTLDHPQRPLFALLGGSLSEEKLLLAEEISRRAEIMFVAGEFCFPFLVARGDIPGSREVTDEMVKAGLIEV